MKKNVLLTGGTGFVGKELTKLLINSGYTVSILSRSKRENTATIFRLCNSFVNTLILASFPSKRLALYLFEVRILNIHKKKLYIIIIKNNYKYLFEYFYSVNFLIQLILKLNIFLNFINIFILNDFILIKFLLNFFLKIVN